MNSTKFELNVFDKFAKPISSIKSKELYKLYMKIIRSLKRHTIFWNFYISYPQDTYYPTRVTVPTV